MENREMSEREKGPIEILCKEIGFRFERDMEREDILVSFVGVLIDHVADMRESARSIAAILRTEDGKPSKESGDVLAAARAMVSAMDKIAAAAAVHDLTHQPDDGPCDHLIDMLSSCASAIRFGLEKPCKSRHTASAADHIWKHQYGIRLFDSFTSNWRNDWARAQLQIAILRLTHTPATSK